MVCVDDQQHQKIIAPQLIDMTYNVHLGLLEENVVLNLKSYHSDENARRHYCGGNITFSPL